MQGSNHWRLDTAFNSHFAVLLLEGCCQERESSLAVELFVGIAVVWVLEYSRVVGN